MEDVQGLDTPSFFKTGRHRRRRAQTVDRHCSGVDHGGFASFEDGAVRSGQGVGVVFPVQGEELADEASMT